MARKHGFRGTPLRPPRGPATLGRVFEQRGDPMVSPREGREKYGRNLDTENPDFDKYFAEDIAKEREREAAFKSLKPSQVDRGNAFRKAIAKTNYDPQRAAASIVMKMTRELNKATVNVKDNRKKEEPVPPDNIPAVVHAGSKDPSRQKQTPVDVPHKSFIDFTGKSPKREIIKNGKVYRRK